MWNTQKRHMSTRKTKEKEKIKKSLKIMPFSLLFDKISRQHKEYNDFQKESSVSELCEETLQINFTCEALGRMFLFFFYMLNSERSIVRIILPHRRWMSRDFEDLSEELYRFNKMNQMCQVIKLWSNAELTVEKTQEHIKASGYQKTRRGRDRGYWKVSMVRFEWRVFLAVSSIVLHENGCRSSIKFCPLSQESGVMIRPEVGWC